MAWVETTSNPFHRAIIISDLWDPISGVIDNQGLLDAITSLQTDNDNFYGSKICDHNPKIAQIDYAGDKDDFQNRLNQEPASLYNGEWHRNNTGLYFLRLF